jgi:hypothetical protein
MVNVDSNVLWLANSTFNAAGVIAAAATWGAAFDGKRRRLTWVVPIVLLSAWLETNLNVAYAGAATMTPGMYRHLAVDLAAFAGLALAFVLIRRKAAFSAARKARPASVSGDAVEAKSISNPQLRQNVVRLLESADRADVSSLAEVYDPDFESVRVADEGGSLGRLTREQMLAFLTETVRGAAVAVAANGHAAVKTGETVIHHAEDHGDTAFVLMTRTKDLGNGWEPMFYSLVWKKRSGSWRLLREFVHQKTRPRWS